MDNLFTRDDIDLAIAGCHTFLNSGLLEQPEIIRGYRESVDLTGETKKTLNLLENVLHWMKKAEAAPQAQEEPSGAPAPEPQSPRKGWTWIPGHWLRWWESGSATVWPNGTWHTFDSDGGGGENASDPTIGEAMDEAEKAIKRQGFDQATEDEEEPQPPAPASPAGLVWTKEKPKVEGYYWNRASAGDPGTVILDVYECAGIMGAEGASFEWRSLKHIVGEWAGPIPEPAAPEAGAPGTQGAT